MALLAFMSRLSPGVPPGVPLRAEGHAFFWSIRRWHADDIGNLDYFRCMLWKKWPKQMRSEVEVGGRAVSDILGLGLGLVFGFGEAEVCLVAWNLCRCVNEGQLGCRDPHIIDVNSDKRYCRLPTRYVQYSSGLKIDF